MTANITAVQPDIIGLYIVVIIYFLSIVISTIISVLIVYLIYTTPSLRTSTNLLVSNTCLCTLIFSGVSTINAFFLLMESTSTDWSCRIRGYLTYVSVCLVSYSFVIQAVSRFFWTVLYKYRYLLTMRFHFYLILIQLSLSFVLPSSSIITTNIIFRPFQLCVVSIAYKIHCLYLLSVLFCVPNLITIVLYIIIYRNSKNPALNTRRLLHRAKRDRILARNILILLSIFLFGGIPLCLYFILSNGIESLPSNFFWFTIATPALTVVFEKIATVALNEEIRKVIKRRWLARQRHRIAPIYPLNN